MNDALFTVLCLALAMVFALWFGYVIGRGSGLDQGRAEGWLEHYDSTARRERARHDALGRFKKPSAAKSKP